jgi:site-specific recombinase XerC
MIAATEYRLVISSCLAPTQSAPRTPVQHSNAARAVREATLISLGWACGLTAEEVSELAITSFDSVTHVLTVGGKHLRQRRLALTGPPLELLRSWLDLHDGSTPAVFYGFSSAGVTATSSLSAGRIREIVNAATLTALERSVRFSELRKSFEEEVRKQVPARIVDDLLGKSSRRTTAFGALDLRKMAAALEHMAGLSATGLTLQGRRV